MSRLDKFEDILKSYDGRELVSDTSMDFLLEWQLRAYRGPGQIGKALLVFDASQEKLVQEGYERHALSAEAFALICAYLDDQKSDNKLLTPEQTDVAKDMRTSHGEFFCQAIETMMTPDEKAKKATIYELVTVFPRNAANDGYEKAGMKCGTSKTFDISDLELNKYNHYKNIHDKHDDLIEYVTSRKYADLPDEIKETGGIVIPEPGRVWPVGRVIFGSRFYIGSYGNDGASRGVRSPQKKVTL